MTAATDTDLLTRWQALMARKPRPAFARDAAALLGATEGMLAEARRPTGATVPLHLPDGPAPLLAALAGLGDLMAMTRNDACVLETTGPFPPPVAAGDSLALRGAIDLDLRPGDWHVAYLVSEQTSHGPQTAIQAFDAAGDALHKIYVTPATDRAAFDALTAGLLRPDAPPVRYTASPDAPTATPAGRVVDPAAPGRLLRLAAAEGWPLSLAVGNRGCLQRYAGPVRRIEQSGTWVNVLDPALNLHLREDLVAAARVSGDGTALDLADAAGRPVCRMASAAEGWREALAALPAA
jgi:putative hemin transport protein